ncbi:Mus7/MMS22 family-domain-containing protein [Xylaria sp. CBS 124048]|nr:Mus7/MMS22 family-domain-containing protein [Xylaria sp. CBS 124048]
MAKWQELGEVPDSEDESAWDSQESLPNALGPLSAFAADAEKEPSFQENAAGSASQDIWEVPSFSQPSVGEHDAVLCPKPPGPGPSLPTIDLPIDEPQPTAPLSSLIDLGHRINAPASGLSSQVRESEEPGPASQTEPSEPSATPISKIQDIPAAYDTEQAIDERTELGRSLRPRKPIQQHPYLLESAQYSRTWKSHGLRPVRVWAEEEKRRRPEEDSQEQDFEDDSQVTSRDTAQEESEESQATRNSEHLLEIDERPLLDDFALSPTPEPIERPEKPIQSSQEEDEEEFPDPTDFEKWKTNKASRPIHKRRASPQRSSKVKVPRLDASSRVTDSVSILRDVDHVFDIPSSPLADSSPDVLAVMPVAAVNRLEASPVGTLTPKPTRNLSRKKDELAETRQYDVIDLTTVENEDSSKDNSDEADAHASEGETNNVRFAARRMRGVLPASWLRLDQKSSTQKAKPNARHRSPGSSPERSARKGVAQRRLLSPRTKSGAASLRLDDFSDSDDSDSTVRLQQPSNSLRDINSPALEDDAASVIEEDQVDRMFSRAERATTGPGGLRKKRKRSAFKGQPEQRKRQQRITGHLNHIKSTAKTRVRPLQVVKDSVEADRPQKRNIKKRTSTHTQPPRLSILDVVEPNAPAFIRIAARTAGRRRDRGRSSPSKKVIMLGRRQDTIDAVEVLKSWSEGGIQPRNSTSHSSSSPDREDELIGETAQSHLVQMSGYFNDQSSKVTPFIQPRRMVKQTSLDGFVDIGARSESGRGLPAGNSAVKRHRAKVSYRPAQLETTGDITSRSTFDVRKRALDAIYRRSGKQFPPFQNARLEHSISIQAPARHEQPAESPKSPRSEGVSKPSGNQRRLILKKQRRPQFVDVSAPQHAHANDPLPRESNLPIVVLDVSQSEETGKLLGLAPYGTHYTQHFEIFPLDRGVFFHESTIVGSGRLKKSLDGKTTGNLNGHRGRCTFALDKQTLIWGPWDARTSSEFGIIFDWVMDRLSPSSAYREPEVAAAVQAAEFVLTYLQDHLVFIEPESSNVFAIRLVDVLRGFERRLKEISGDSSCLARPLIEVVTRVLIITMQALRLCQQLGRFTETFQTEEILKRLAATTAEVLLRAGLREVRDVYGNLQQVSFREKGIRNDQHITTCWVVLIRILEEARLPRAGFWEVVSSAILSPSADSTSNAAVLEQAWRTLFTILPLGEFDNAGVAIPGMRHTSPLEGWTLPQRLLRRVFNLYQSNSRQSAGFNDYLRAAVSRCHYLVEQWGWHKCHAILGAIFDFFAAQDLHNIRNEEAYQSPQFLEEISASPSLAVSVEDRCFHIFLKLIAISIKRLRRLDMMKEIKNLVARLLPNHSRQYDKMMETHEAEIAALRNHHDLLCTIFWAAPPDMRPSIQSIEGLVVLRNSHKEACLISLRTWSRLSRFVVSSCEDISAYKMLADWQRNICQQVLDQFLSVETEIDQQLRGMSAEASKQITQEHKNAVISKNKRVALSLLHFSMKASLDVMRHTRSLGATSFVLNHYPLEQILIRLSFSSSKSDWGILQAVLDIIDYYLAQIGELICADPRHLSLSQDQEDAIMLLERKFASHLVSVVRGVVNLTSQGVSIGQMREHDLCAERAVTLTARLGACLIRARLARFRQFFQVGSYNLFQDVSKDTRSSARRYVGLFLATMLDQGVTDFEDLGLVPLDVFLSEITKPHRYLAYENLLAMRFKRLGEAYLENAVIKVGETPNYGSNRDLFNCSISAMRKALLRAVASQKAHLQNLFSKVLGSIMDRMKTDLRSMDLNSPEHLNHVEFVRSIISLIRSQDLCPVDSFFYQISPEYSPSREDPRLQTAGILSWGLKLEEGDSKAMYGLFYLLFPSFKVALANGDLQNESNILKESMQHEHVFDFMLNPMLSAIVSTATQVSEGWILLDTYVESIDARFSSACIHREIDGKMMPGVLALYTTIMVGAKRLGARASSAALQNEDIVTLTNMIKILNIFSSSVTAHLVNEPESPIANDIAEMVDRITDFTVHADKYLSVLLPARNGQALVCEPHLFATVWIPESGTALHCDEQIEKFSTHMTQDIRNNWVLNGGSITVKAPSRPSRPSATQSGEGTCLPELERSTVFLNLHEEFQIWNYAHNEMMRTKMQRALLDEFFF